MDEDIEPIKKPFRTTLILGITIGAGIVIAILAYGFLMSHPHSVASVARHTARANVPPNPSVSDAVLKSAYPLYAHSEWSPEQLSTVHALQGYSVTSKPSATTTDIFSITSPFQTYYSEKLIAAGWQIDTSLAADGPGSSVWAYTKGVQTLLFGYTSTFEDQTPGQPEQCPCAVTFTIFGGTPTPTPEYPN